MFMFEIVDAKLKDILIVQNDQLNLNPTLAERLIDMGVPDWYPRFLLAYGGSFLKDDYAYRPIEKTPVTDNGGFDTFSYFFSPIRGNGCLLDAIDSYYDLLDCRVVPIADTSHGDIVCMGLDGDMYGKIYYWHHENEFYDENGNEKLYLIAHSFVEFIDIIEYNAQDFDVSNAVLIMDDDMWNN